MTRPPGRRDYALFLLMALYGMGAGEVSILTLDDVDWRARTIRVRRRKTGTVTDLSLVDPIAHALAAYVSEERPKHARTRAIFVTDHIPHRPLGSVATITSRLKLYASRAGVDPDHLGTHGFRYAHAIRQVEAGVKVKLIADVLGHKSASATSAYLRSAIVSLRSMSLPVPR